MERKVRRAASRIGPSELPTEQISVDVERGRDDALVIELAHGFASGGDAHLTARVGVVGQLQNRARKCLCVSRRHEEAVRTVIHDLASWVEGRSAIVVAQGMVLIEVVLDVLIPSTSGKAVISMPLLGPIGTLSGVSGQTTVLAFLFGNGLTNMVTPTSGMLLAYLATGGVSYGQWIRFIMPLVAVLFVLSMIVMAIAVTIGY